MKRLLFSFLFVLTAIAGWAQTTFTQGDFTYTVTDEDAKTVSIAKAEAATLTGALVIPTSVTEAEVTYAVTSIAENAFQGQSITSVTIPSSIMSIDGWAFRDCYSLANIRIEDSENPLSMVDGYWSPFSANNAYTYITERNVYIGRNLTLSGTTTVFDGITSVEFGPNVTTINSYLFYQAAKLSSVTIGNGVTTIGDFAFQEAGTSVEEMVVTMGNGVTSIGEYAFYSCSHLKAVTLPSSLTEIKAYAFQSTGLTRITIPASVTNIREWAFRDCISLTNISIEDSENPLSMVGGYYNPFSANNAYTYITERNVYLGRNLTLSETSSVFDGITSVEFGPNVTTINQSMFYQATNLSSAIIGSGVTTIGDQAFLGCSKLTSVNIREGVTRIGEQAFHSTGLTSVTIPASVMTIGNEAFNFINALESVTIADSETPLTLENSYYGAFQNGDGYGINYYTRTIYIGRNIVNSTGRVRTDFDTAEDVIIGPKVTTINESMFYGCQHLRSVVIGDGVTSIGDNAFYNCGTFVGGEGHEEATVSKLTVTMGKNVKTIGDGAFLYCSKLTSIEIPNGVTRIGVDAFNNSGLTSVTIPASVETIGNQAFNFINSLESVTIADGDTPLTLENTYYGTFQNGDADGRRYTKKVYLGRNINNYNNRNRTEFDTVEELTVGPKVTTLRPYMFAGCYGLQSVDMTNATSLTSISEYAFADITDITSVKIPWLTPIAINENVFASGAYSSATLFVPAGTKEAYAAASIWKNFTNMDHWSTLVTLTASTHGSIVTAEATASNGTEQYRQPKNDDIVYTLTADEGYELTALTDNDAAVSPLPTLGEEQTRANTEGEEFVTLNASFTPITYTLTYTLNGGTATNPATYTIETTTFTLNNPTKAGYDFAGWKLNGEGEAMMTVTIAQGSTGHLAYTATWTPTVYNIVYTMDGGTATPANPTTYTIETETFTLNNPTKTGYTFKGWKLNGEGDAMMEVTIAQGSTGNLAYTATWTPITYNIVYTMDGGTATPDNPTTYTIETETFTLNNPTKAGYDFAGWKLNGVGEAMMTVTITQGSTGHLAYTATWTPITYNIVYTMDGGTATPDNPTTYTIETETFTLNNPTKTGYTFKGWKLNGEGDAMMEVTIAQGSTGHLAYTATWQVNQYTITFDSNGGSAVDAITQDYGTVITSPDDPTRTGYDFDGWSPAVPATMPAENMTVVAQWTKTTYTVTITGGGVTADNTTPEYGDNVVLTIMDDPDATLTSLTVNGTEVKDDIVANQYTIENVSGNISVVATWNSTKEFITLGSDIATFSCTQDLNFTGSELKAYIAAGYSKDGNTVLLVRVYDVPANTGLVIKGTQGDTYKIPYSTSQSYFVNMLKAHTTADAVPVTEGDYTNFILQKNGDDYVWNHDTEGTMLLGAKKAYLQLPTSFVSGNSARQMSMIFEDELTPTEIRDNYILLQESKYNGRIYNLNGQQIDTMQKGVNIVNGRKILK